MEKEISQAVIRRIPRYYRCLGELIDEGTERISSKDLSRRMSVTASQIRQDLNNFGGFGQQGYATPSPPPPLKMSLSIYLTTASTLIGTALTAKTTFWTKQTGI